MGKGRKPCCDKSKVKKGPWTPCEDLKLITFIQNYGHSNWRALPSQAGLLRCGKSCRLRWINYLRPDVKRGNFTPREEEAVLELHHTYGNKWSKIASFFPGRTDNEIKNIWNTHLKKRLGIQSNKRNTSRRTKSKRPSKASIVESTSSKSSSSLLDSDQVDRNSKAIMNLNSMSSDYDTSITLKDGGHNESTSSLLLSCISDASTNNQSRIHTNTNSGTSNEGMHTYDIEAFDELGSHIPFVFDEPNYWNIVELDNLCSLQTTEIDGFPFNTLDESHSIDFVSNHSLAGDTIIENWARNLEIELGLE